MTIKYKLLYVDTNYYDSIYTCALGLEWKELQDEDELLLLKNAVLYYNTKNSNKSKSLVVLSEFDYDNDLEALISDYKSYIDSEKKLQQKKEEEELKRKEAANAKKAEKDLEKKRKMLEKLKKELGENT